MSVVVVERAVVSSSMMPFQLLGCRGLRLWCERKNNSWQVRSLPANAESAILAPKTLDRNTTHSLVATRATFRIVSIEPASVVTRSVAVRISVCMPHNY